MRQRDPWSARSIYYLAKTLVNQLKQGENYESLNPVVGIHLLGFDLFTDPSQALWCFELRDRRQHQVRLGQELQLHIVELFKADRLNPASASLSAWITFFQHSQEETRMNQVSNPSVQQAFERLKALSADEETQRLAFVRERALRLEEIFAEH